MRRPAVVNGKVMRTPSYDDSSMSMRGASAPVDVALSINQEFVAHDARTHTRDKALLVRLGVNGEVPLAQALANAGLTIAANDNFKYAVAA